MADTTSVKVAVRVRPLVPNEIDKGCKEIVETIAENEQIVIKNCDKAFTFNYALGADSPQEELYTRCVAPLLKNLFEGFNVTIFAYGQTGSGKTHSMGTAYSGEHNVGVIPRAVNEIFDFIRDQFAIDFNVTVSFTELYREVLYDLLANKPREQCTLELREDISKGVYIPNLTEVPVDSAHDVLNILMKGSQGRATASTNMNAQSSRSHSIFTVNLAMQHKTEKHQNKTAKLHLVDLAGSERPKKTGAQGNTFKEGVDINKGLFVLGNVISALGDEKAQNGFIPYRDSNLTRLLKDSLGGNSVTLMIACISPADYNLEETISTLRYADRARKIKNKPIVNQDPKTAEINELKRQLKQLQLQIVGQGGPMISSEEIDKLKSENKELSLKIKELMVQLSAALLEKTGLHEKLMILQSANEVLSKKLRELTQQYNTTFTRISQGVENNDVQCIKESLSQLQDIQEHFGVLQNDQMKTEDEIRTHEETFTILVHTAKNGGDATPKEIQEKQESHTTRQLVLNSELQQVSQQLMLKEQLAKQLATNTRYMVDEQIMVETERKIESLEKEKDELMQQLKNVKAHENSNKLAENRRKRVQELEDQLKDLKKKVVELSRLVKLKEKDERKVKQLHQEIVAMKTTKVKLLKQMREETDRFRSWRQQTERELARIKQQDRKKETEIAKMKVTHEKQKNVLKRKFEEAAALNKRLQSTLMKRKQAHDMRFAGKSDKVVSWLKEELDVYVNLAEAEVTLAGLLEDRATLQQQLDELKKNPELAESVEIKTIEEDIELRSVQIQDLQQKLLDSDEENKSKTRFDTIQSMVEAKLALRSLFDQAADYHKGGIQTKRELSELQDAFKENTEKMQKLQKDMEKLENNYADQIANIEKASQEKIGILLMQMRGIRNHDVSLESEIMQRCQIQSERIEHQESVIDEQQKTIQALKQQLENIKKVSSGNLAPTLPKVKKEKSKSMSASSNVKSEEEATEAAFGDLLSDHETSMQDDTENDPDWRNTPLGKRIIHAKRTHNKLLRASNIQPNDDPLFPGGSKRSSEGGCTCKTSCNTLRCKCNKLNRSCGSACKCNESSCALRDNDKVTSTEADRDSTNSLASTSTEDLSSDNMFMQPTKRRLKHRQQLFNL